MTQIYPDPPGDLVPADAEPPTWQPWVQTQAEALSRLKTEIQASLRTLNRSAGDAGRILDIARSIANEQAGPLETAAWAAWHKYMTEARTIRDSIMRPAVAAYEQALDAAHDQLKTELVPVEHSYARIAADAQWTQTLTHPGGATL